MNTRDVQRPQVALDWNCIISLEEGRPDVVYLRQLQTWHMQGKITLWFPGPSRLENPRDREKLSIGHEEWDTKMRNVGLADIELRYATTRAFLSRDGRYIFDESLEHLIRREIHAILSPSIDYMYNDYCLREGVEPYNMHAFLNLSEVHQAATEKQRRIARKWNNAKCDSLSLHAYSTWSGPNDLFVTDDNSDIIKRKDRLQQPFRLSRVVLAPLPGITSPYSAGTPLTEQIETVEIFNVIQGHLMRPPEAVEHLQQHLGEQ